MTKKKKEGKERKGKERKRIRRKGKKKNRENGDRWKSEKLNRKCSQLSYLGFKVME